MVEKPVHVIVSTLLAMAGFGAATALGQVARFDSYQFQQVPENANINLFPFYSDLAFFQSLGVRNISSSGAGMDYLYGGRAADGTVGGGTRYGRVQEDGVDFPFITQLTARNYLLISKYMSIDFSVALTYRGFPNGTEEDTFDVEIVDPGFYAQMGSFSFGATKEGWLGAFNGRNIDAYSGTGRSGFSANLSMDFELTPFVRGRLYDKPSYRIDYVDQHGYTDNLSGQRYPVFQNLAGIDLDWQMAEDKNFSYTFERVDTIPQDNEYDINRSVVYHSMADYRQQLNPLTAAGVRADHYWRDYQGGRGKQFQQDYLAYMTSDLTENSTLSGGIGYSMAEMTGAGAYETNGTSDAVIGNIALRTRLSESLSHGIGYSRLQRAAFMAGFEVVDRIHYQIQWADPESWAVGLTTAYETVDPRLAAVAPYADWTTQLTAARPLAHDLVLTLATAYSARMNDQTGAGMIGEDNIFLDNDYDTWVTTGGLIKSFTENLKLYAYVEHLERLSSNPLLEGTRDTVGLTLGYYNDF